MVKGKQRNLRVFEFEPCEENAFREYIERNQVLLKDFLILLSFTISEELAEFLRSKDLIFMQSAPFESLKNNNRTRSKIPSASFVATTQTTQDLETLADSTTQTQKPMKSLVLNRVIRSGEEINTEGDIVIYGRVNSGARIYAGGNLQIYGEIDGIVESEGDFVILTKIGQGSVFFGGEFLSPTLFNGEKKVIFRDQSSLVIS